MEEIKKLVRECLKCAKCDNFRNHITVCELEKLKNLIEKDLEYHNFITNKNKDLEW